MHISVYNSQRAISLSCRRARTWVEAIIDYLDLGAEGVAIHFVGKRKICALHRLFFDDPTPTDCITFPCDPPAKKNRAANLSFLGDIFICPQVAKDYARAHKKSWKEELALYVIHGLLHLAGYDDQTPRKRQLMRRAEKRCLQLLAQKGILC